MEVVDDILRAISRWLEVPGLRTGRQARLQYRRAVNIRIPLDTHANISRVNADGSGFESFAHGVRNSVGFDCIREKELYFTTHGRDWLGDDVPSDRFDHAPRRACTSASPIATRAISPTRSSARGIVRRVRGPADQDGPARGRQRRRVYTGSMFPAEYKNRAFLAQRGSWNRTKKIGFRVMMVTLRPGDVPKYDVFAEGWLDGDNGGAGPSTPSR